MIRSFPQSPSMSKVNQTSMPLRRKFLPGQRNTFLAVC